MLNIGIMVPSLATSQLAFLAINQCNLFHMNNDVSCTLFYSDASRPCVRPKTPIMNITEIHGFKGVLISTDIDSTIMSLKAATAAKRVFYVWDLEWIRRGKNNFNHNMQAFRDPRVTLCARSVEHARAISQYCNINKVLVVPNMNLLELLEMI